MSLNDESRGKSKDARETVKLKPMSTLKKVRDLKSLQTARGDQSNARSSSLGF